MLLIWNSFFNFSGKEKSTNDTTQGLNLGLLHCRQILYCLSHQGSPWPPSVQFSSLQSLSHVWLFATPWTATRQASLSITNSWNWPKLTPIESVMTSKHLILCHPLLLPSFPTSRSFPVSQLFASGGQSIGVSVSTSILPRNTQDWSPLWWTGWISSQSKELSRVFSNSIVQKHQFFGTQLSLKSNSHIHTWLLEKP